MLLDAEAVDVDSFKADWLRLNFYGSNGERLTVKDANEGSAADWIGLNGPWAAEGNEAPRLGEAFGVDAHTLTAMFELAPSKERGFIDTLRPLIGSVQVEYDNRLSRRQDPLANPVKSIELDYLSSSDAQ